MTVELDAAAVAAVLRGKPVTLTTALEPEAAGGLPMAAGFYAWWVEAGTIAGVPHHPHPAKPELGLLYVGISPKRPSSSGLIRSRVINQHVKGNTSSSTFRFVLASLLLDELRLRPRATIKKVVLDPDDNARLRQWQFDHTSLTWCERPRPWEIEDVVIALMQPPLNSTANQNHPFYPRVHAARAAFRAAGRASIIRTPVQAPNANAHVERWVGSVRRECLDRLLIVDRRQLEHVLRVYVRHHNSRRPHRSLDLRAPDSIDTPITQGSPPTDTAVVHRHDLLGGLIHEYELAPAA